MTGVHPGYLAIVVVVSSGHILKGRSAPLQDHQDRSERNIVVFQ
jgi:hypothetical protein